MRGKRAKPSDEDAGAVSDTEGEDDGGKIRDWVLRTDCSSLVDENVLLTPPGAHSADSIASSTASRPGSVQSVGSDIGVGSDTGHSSFTV